MATVKGVWVFNETISLTSGITSAGQTVNFTTAGYSCTKMYKGSDFDSGDAELCYTGIPNSFDLAYHSVGGHDGDQGWQDEAYKTVDFGTTEQTVDDTFYTWLTANATHQATEETNGVTVEYNGSVVATIPNGNKATIPIADKKMKSDLVVTVPEATDSAIPIEVATEAEMNALLESGEVGGVYKYTGTTGTYENGALYVLENDLITFTVTDNYQYTETTYQAEPDMTWGEWIASGYNTDGFNTNNPFILTSDSMGVQTADGTDVRDTDTIIADHNYIVPQPSTGGGG